MLTHTHVSSLNLMHKAIIPHGKFLSSAFMALLDSPKEFLSISLYFAEDQAWNPARLKELLALDDVCE